ncbi:MAG: methionyl-tRNA formyltransferase [Hyphomicrobium sp.]|nr:methionyl-tRNA formyltransferase [Hyphomicrobium sp.]
MTAPTGARCSPAFKDYVKASGLGLVELSTAKEAENLLRQREIDIGFVCGWYWMLGAELLNRVPLGYYGIHYSLLPKYRGFAPLVWALINGEKQVGLSLFRFSAGMDEGDIVRQMSLDVGDNDTIADVMQALEDMSQTAVREHWNLILNRTAVLTRQPAIGATYGAQRRPEHGLIDWRLSAQRIHNFVRAQAPPYPGAFTSADGKKIVILRTTVDSRTYYGTPGQIIERSDQGLLVTCGEASALLVERLRTEAGESTARDGLKGTAALGGH